VTLFKPYFVIFPFKLTLMVKFEYYTDIY